MQESTLSAQRIKSDLLLLLASVIWGSGFIAQRIAANSMGSFLFNGGRFLLGMIIFLLVTRFWPKIEKKQLRWGFTIGEFAVAAGLNMICAGLFERGNVAPQMDAWWAILFSGIFPVAIAFTIQVYGQRSAPPIDASLIFSLEAVFAAIFGYWLLSEKLQPIQVLGCGLILAALLLAQSVNFRKKAVVSLIPEEE